MNGDGFFVNEYLDGEKIDEHLLVATPEMSSLIGDYLKSF